MNPLPTLLSVVLAITSLTPVALAAPQGDVHIRVDQFGYRPLAQKVAVIRVAQRLYPEWHLRSASHDNWLGGLLRRNQTMESRSNTRAIG